MKFSTSKNELQVALQKLSKATPLRSTLPVLSCVLINATNKKTTLVANKLSRYRSLLIKASRYIYSTPKYSANIVNVSTRDEATSARLSIQNTRCESIKSRQKNQRPKSTNI